jgi:cbb3-type cytochrome oxidase subunit 3
MMHVEPMTKADLKRVESGVKNDMVAMYFVIGVGVFTVLVWLYTGQARGSSSIFTVVLVPIAIGVIWWTKRKFKRGQKNKEKEIYIGPIQKRIKSVRNRSYPTYYFLIDGTKFPVSSKTFKQYNEGDNLRIERSKETQYVLSVKANGSPEQNS